MSYSHVMTRRTLTLLAGVALLMAVAIIPGLSFAQAAGGLQKGTTVFEQLKDWIWVVVPIVCLIAGAGAGLAYSLDWIRKDTLYQVVTGVVFSGAIVGAIIDLAF